MPPANASAVSGTVRALIFGGLPISGQGSLSLVPLRSQVKR